MFIAFAVGMVLAVLMMARIVKAVVTAEARRLAPLLDSLPTAIGQVKASTVLLEAASKLNTVSNTGLLTLLTELGVRLDEVAASGLRIEVTQGQVADDLDQSHLRADGANGPPGEAADAASRSGVPGPP